MNKMAVIISGLVGLGFMVMSLLVDAGEERTSVLLYSIICFLFGILTCAFEMAFV